MSACLFRMKQQWNLMTKNSLCNILNLPRWPIQGSILQWFWLAGWEMVVCARQSVRRRADLWQSTIMQQEGHRGAEQETQLNTHTVTSALNGNPWLKGQKPMSFICSNFWPFFHLRDTSLKTLPAKYARCLLPRAFKTDRKQSHGMFKKYGNKTWTTALPCLLKKPLKLSKKGGGGGWLHPGSFFTCFSCAVAVPLPVSPQGSNTLLIRKIAAVNRQWIDRFTLKGN